MTIILKQMDLIEIKNTIAHDSFPKVKLEINTLCDIIMDNIIFFITKQK